VEGGHVAAREAGEGDEPRPVVRHAMQPWQALFLDGRAPVESLSLVDCAQVTLLRAEPVQAGRRG